jgi:NAD(P)H-flavin reductase
MMSISQEAVLSSYVPIFVSIVAVMLSVRYVGSRFFASKSFLSKDVAKPATLVARQKLNHNTYVLTFDTNNLPVQLPIGKHMQVVADVGTQGNTVQRAYTPTAVYQNAFDLLIKVYRPTERFPKGGAMSQYLESLPVGSELLVKGPVGRLEYLGQGEFELVRPQTASSAGVKASPAAPTNPTQFPVVRKSFTKIGMIAGGSGITPMYQIIKAVEAEHSGPKKPSCSLIYGNQTPEDILLHKELEALSANKAVQLSLTVDRGTSDWRGLVGLMDAEKLKTYLPAPSDDTLILVCGPPMMNKVVKETLENQGHQWIHIF